MELNTKVREDIIKCYVILFYLVAAYELLAGQLLFQLQPLFFLNNLDVTTWLIMLSEIQHLLIKSQVLLIVFDAVFYLLPLVYYFTILRKPKLSTTIGFLMLFFNFIYITIYCRFPTVSIEDFIAILLFPFLFITNSVRSFWFIFHGLRYFFLYFFVSAGIWKFVQGGIFNIDQMSGILRLQHKEALTLNDPSVLHQIYSWLIFHPQISYWLYFTATVMELFFIIGFFTRQMDKWLMLLFILFLIFDYLIMQINYLPVIPFIITLYFSMYQLQKGKLNGILPN